MKFRFTFYTPKLYCGCFGFHWYYDNPGHFSISFGLALFAIELVVRSDARYLKGLELWNQMKNQKLAQQDLHQQVVPGKGFEYVNLDAEVNPAAQQDQK